MSSNMPNSVSFANTSTTSSFSNKSCYRLYAGHGNWINLNAKTTQELLRIFEKGEPCRYQLAPGLFIDIIPNDVDCNSKNIDMVGLMRADLVYEPQMMENHVQQQMSHYIRSLLDEQGIIDAFPPLRQGEDLPIITSIPTHRHLSLVPSVVGTVRRGPKSTVSLNQQRKSSSSSSSATMTDDDHLAMSSSSSPSATHDSVTSGTRKRALGSSNTSTMTRRSHLKRSRQNSSNIDSIELISHQPKRHMLALELPILNSVPMSNSIFTTNSTAASINMSSFMDHNNHSNGSNGLLGFHQQSHHNHQLQHQTNSNFWLPSYQSSPTPTSTRSSGGFNFEFGMDFDHTLQPQSHHHHKQSPTDILHEYDTNSFSHQMMSNEQHLYSGNAATVVAAAAAAAATHQLSNVDHSHLLSDNQQHMMTTASSSDTTSLESFVPASPIPTNWLENHHHLQQQQQQQHHHHHQQQQQQRNDSHWHQYHDTTAPDTQQDNKNALATEPFDSSVADDLKKLKFEYTEPSQTSTSADIDLIGDQDNKDNIFLTHVDVMSSSSTSSSSSPTTTSQ